MISKAVPGSARTYPNGLVALMTASALLFENRAIPEATSTTDRSVSRAINWICVLFPTLIPVPLGTINSAIPQLPEESTSSMPKGASMTIATQSFSSGTYRKRSPSM